MKKRKFSNGIQYKLKNRRITVFEGQKKDIGVSFKRFDKQPSEEKTCFVINKRNTTETAFFISYEAGIALYKALGEFIKLSDIPSHLLNKEENEQI